jgi:hypothetical protein
MEEGAKMLSTLTQKDMGSARVVVTEEYFIDSEYTDFGWHKFKLSMGASVKEDPDGSMASVPAAFLNKTFPELMTKSQLMLRH